MGVQPMTDSIDVLCGKCKVPLTVPDDPKPDDMVTCPKCGASDRYDVVSKKAVKDAKALLVKMAKDAFKDL